MRCLNRVETEHVPEPDTRALDIAVHSAIKNVTALAVKHFQYLVAVLNDARFLHQIDTELCRPAPQTTFYTVSDKYSFLCVKIYG
jgi:hypothetical protein